MTDSNGGNGRKLPVFRNDFSLGQIVTMLVSAASVLGGLWALSLRYENRVTVLETNDVAIVDKINDAASAMRREIDRLDRDIGLAREVGGLRRETRTLIDLHQDRSQ